MTWVLEDAPVSDPVKLLILFALSDRADSEGRSAYPSQAWIAERARCSQRTVARHLKEMEESGVIRRGDQSLVAHFPANRRPVVWDIDFDYRPSEPARHDTTVCPDNLSAQTDSGVWGVTPGNSGVTAVADKPSFFLTEETVRKPSSARNTSRGTRLPEDWWPDPELIEEMRTERPDVDPVFETKKFVDHWCGKAAGATKKDWRRTWRNWIRNARPTPGRPVGGIPRADQKVQGYLDYARNLTNPETPRELSR